MSLADPSALGQRLPLRVAAAVLALIWLPLLPMKAEATAFVALDDGRLADRSPVILEARILAIEPAPGPFPATDYLVQIERLIKGQLPPGNLVVRIPGGIRADGGGLHIWGAPRFRQGELALLFLEPRGDGTFALHQFLLGAFHLTEESKTRIARRDLSGALQLIPPGTDPPQERARDYEGFRRWLEDRGSGRESEPDYFLAAPQGRDAGAAGPPLKFQTPVSTTDPPPLGCGATGGHSMRWFEFDHGGTIGWRTHFSGQDGLEDGGVGAFRTALEAWNDDPNTPISYSYLGLTNATGSLAQADGVNAVLFGDPNDEIGGVFDGSGLLALGGARFSCSLTSYEGESFHPILEADILTQDGIELLFAFSDDPQKTAEQLLAHELGHTLGLAHSTQPDALMVAELHPDARGAALDTDDLAGILYLYGPRNLLPPAPPSGLDAGLAAPASVRLEWTDNSGNESVFRIDRRTTGNFELLATVAADEVSFLDSSVRPETLYRYRVRAQNGAGSSAYTGEVEILTPEDQRPAAPTNLRAAPLSTSEIRLAWQDNSGNEDGFLIEILLDSIWTTIPTTLPLQTTRAVISGLTPGTAFTFRVRAINQFGRSEPSNTATAVAFDSDSRCFVTDEELCLLGGRFKISARFRDPNSDDPEATAVAVPQTDQTGLFWFFGPENIELGVKVLDGRGFNDHFWVFYGALSNLEYWIHVTDTHTGEAAIYHNPPGEVCGVADTFAFTAAAQEPSGFTASGIAAPPLDAGAATAEALQVASLIPEKEIETPSPTALETGSCETSGERLCLLDNRLSVEVRWRTREGFEGDGRAIVDTENSGFFWFFNIENIELIVKILDGGPLNGNLWLFYGALTDVEYWITVKDTLTGESRVYYNPLGEVCGAADFDAFVADPSSEPPEELTIPD